MEQAGQWGGSGEQREEGGRSVQYSVGGAEEFQNVWGK